MPSPVVQSVASLIADLGAVTSTLALHYTFAVIYHEIFSSHFPPSAVKIPVFP